MLNRDNNFLHHYLVVLLSSCPPSRFRLVAAGVLAFYRELDLGVTGDDCWDDAKGPQGNLVFLSARPHLYKVLVVDTSVLLPHSA